MEFYHILKEAPSPSPKKLNETARLGLRRCQLGQATPGSGAAQSAAAAAVGAGARCPRRQRRRAQRLRSERPLRCAAPRGFGGCGTPGTAPPEPSRAEPGAAAPSPARPAEQSPRQRSPAASRRLLPSPTAPPPAENPGARVRAGVREVTPLRSPFSGAGRVSPSQRPRPRPGSLRALRLRAALNLQTSSSSRPGRGVCETPLLHAAPAAQPLPQPLPGEARPGSGLVLALLFFPSVLRRPPTPEAGKGGEKRLTTRICLWNGAKESSRITAPGKRREEKRMGDKKK